MHILVADDEKNIRAGICKVLAESVLSIAHFSEAKNGEDALKILKTQHVDILITDIRMPKLDGISLMMRLSELEQKPVMIVLSGYDEFTYAKNALKYGASSYLLKPVNNEELIAEVKTAVKKIQEETKVSTENTIRKALSAQFFGINRKSNNDLHDYYISIVLNPNAHELFEILQKNHTVYSIERDKAKTVILYCDECVKQLLKTYASEQKIYIGTGFLHKNTATIRPAFNEARLALFTRFLKPDTFYFEYYEDNEDTDFQFNNTAFHKLCTLIEFGEQKTIIEQIQSIMQTLKKIGSAQLLYDFFNSARYELIVPFQKHINADAYLASKVLMLENSEVFNSFDEVFVIIQNFSLYLNKILKKTQPRNLHMENAVHYIKTHYGQDIDMTIVANHISMNYSYFSEEFKKYTGENFGTFLRTVRIESAKKLLEHSCYKIYEIALKCGFNDSKYFMKTFKSETGLTPFEFRSNLSV